MLKSEIMMREQPSLAQGHSSSRVWPVQVGKKQLPRSEKGTKPLLVILRCRCRLDFALFQHTSTFTKCGFTGRFARTDVSCSCNAQWQCHSTKLIIHGWRVVLMLPPNTQHPVLIIQAGRVFGRREKNPPPRTIPPPPPQ